MNAAESDSSPLLHHPSAAGHGFTSVTSARSAVRQRKAVGHAPEGVEDLNPTPHTPAHRTWTWPTFALVWTASILNPGSISCGAALLALGLNWWEATLSHFLGGMVTLGLLCLTAWPGVRYGIPFPVLARSSFGHVGAHFCTLSRGAVAIMWLSFEMWAGALGLFTGIGRAAGPGFLAWAPLASSGTPTAGQLLLLLAFAALHCLLIYVGIGRVRQLVYFTTPAQLALFLGVAIWACMLAPLNQSLPSSTSGSAAAWMVSINASIATWSTLVLNVADMSRLCPSQRDQILGQSLGMPVPFAVTGWIGIVAAGATQVAYGTAMWQIPEYFSAWPPVLAVLASLVFAASALVVDVSANLLSPMNDLLNLSPDKLDFRCCGYVCVAAAIAVCPWWTFSSKTGFVQTFLGGYGMVTGAIAGILITDFWVLRRGVLHLHELYPRPASPRPSGAGSDEALQGHEPPAPGAAGSLLPGGATQWRQLQPYPAGVNWRAFASVVLAVAPCCPGFVATLSGSGAPALLAWLYNVSFIFALLVSGAAFWLLTRLYPPNGFQARGMRLSYTSHASGQELQQLVHADSGEPENGDEEVYPSANGGGAGTVRARINREDGV